MAIAAALVPPLATAGIGIALGQWTIAGGAMLLYLTNLIAIAAAGNLVFLLLGFAPPATKKQQRRLLQRGLLGTVLLLFAITVVLGILTVDSVRAARLNRAIDQAVSGVLSPLADTELVQVQSENTPDGTLQLVVTVRSTRQFSRDAVLAMQKDIATRLQRPVRAAAHGNPHHSA